ncbi:MAG TPA: protein kinase, partial [Thermoanaerobaculia bacterium]|nr:protein kinase [Thermoanaerobaculia bacterium]
ALKVLPAELAGDAERLARLEREARALAALSHPNIVTIHSVEEAGGVRFLTMELVEGETLDRLIPAGGMVLDRLLGIAIPLADALAAAHAKGVLHRDLKPANVMVTEERRVKVLDFGLAKLAGERAPDLTQAPTDTLGAMTWTGQILGTVPYMSPEQAQGRAVDARSDLFSLGAVLYEMATGRRPFGGDSAAEVLSAILRDEPSSASELRPELPRQLGRILRRCLAKDPERRFHLAKDLRNELEELREELREELYDARRAGSAEGERRPQAPPPTGAPAPTAVTPPPSPVKRLAARGLPAALLAALLAVGALLWFQRSAPPPPPASDPPAAEPAYARTALAVLPFRNLSADPEDAYFAGGLHDELLTQLSRVAALSLRGRTSVMGYAETTKPIRQIAEELEVGALVEGSIQVVGERLRVNVQLLDAATDEHLWAESYDRTLDDAFAIQSDVAQRVVAAVGAALESGERQAMTEMPTTNAEAYRLYLQGMDYDRRPGGRRQNLEIAQQLFERALALDPEFALAHAALSEVHGRMHWFRFDPSPQRVSAQRAAAETALRLAPELPQAHLAMGSWHYFGRRDWEAALAEYEIGLRLLPNDARLVTRIGYAHRRLGNWDEVLAAFARAAELDPRDAGTFAQLGGVTYLVTRRYAEAMRALDRALALAPDFHEAAVLRGWTSFDWQGELDTLRAALDGIPGDADLGWFAVQRAELLLLERDAVGLLEHLESVRPEVLEGHNFFLPKSLFAAWAHRLGGEPEAARLAFEAALERLGSVPHDLQDDWRVRAARGLALAGLGRREEALGEARWLEQSAVYREDATLGLRLAEARAQILTQAGAAAAALEEIERLLAGPAWLSAHTLRLDPRWDPIRDHPRFQALLAAYADP